MAGGESNGSALATFAGEVVRAIAVDLTKGAGYVVFGGLGGLVILLVAHGGTVPTWTAVLAVVLAFAFGLILRGRAVRRLRARSAEVRRYAAALERHETYASHVAQALDVLQRIVSGDLDVEIPQFVEAGVLEPARSLIAGHAPGHVRLAVLVPREDGERWRMAWAAGHSIPGKAKYDARIRETLSRYAYESGTVQQWSDVTSDRGYRPNPRATHQMKAMLSLPIRWGDRVLGVFNVVSSGAAAFEPTEKTYLESLGGVVSVAVGVSRRDHVG
jgi:hypothetical protein